MSNPDPIKVLVILCGGLGASKLDDIRADLTGIEGVVVADEPKGWNQYKADLIGIQGGYDYQKLAVVSHSLGTHTVVDSQILADYVALIEPVWGEPITGKMDRPNATTVDVFRAYAPLFPQANVDGCTPIIIPGGHNDVCHHPQLRAIIKDRILALTAQPAPTLVVATDGTGAGDSGVTHENA